MVKRKRSLADFLRAVTLTVTVRSPAQTKIKTCIRTTTSAITWARPHFLFGAVIE